MIKSSNGKIYLILFCIMIEKLICGKDMIKNNLGECQAGKQYNISHGMAGKRRRYYLNYGEQALYNHNYLRPSYALNYKTPIEYRPQLG